MTSLSLSNIHEKHEFDRANIKEILDNFLDAIFIFDNKKLLYLNNRATEILGFSNTSEVIGLTLNDFLSENSKNEVSQILSKNKRETFLSCYEICFLDKTESRKKVRTVVSCINFENREAVIAIVRDFKQSKSYEDRLVALHDGTIELTRTSNFSEVVDITLSTLEDALGYKWGGVGEVKGDSIHYQGSLEGGYPDNFILKVDGPGIVARTVRLDETQNIPDVRHDPDYIRVKDDSAGPLMLSELCVPVKHLDDVLAVINLESDEVNAFSHEEQQLVEILANNIASALERIKHLEEIKGIHNNNFKEFIEGYQKVSAMVRHDLKSPLMMINQAVYLLKNEPDDSDVAFEIIKQSYSLIQTIMDDWKHLTHTKNIFRRTEKIKEIVEEGISPTLMSDNVKIQTIVDKSLCYNLDRNSMIRVISNLVKNSIEAMPEGGEITIKSYLESDKLIISVKDTGKGMSDEVQANLFRPFYSTKPDGSGLGLAYCKQVIEEHGGTIKVNSKEGEGTKFIIIIPPE